MWARINSFARATVSAGPSVKGSVITPFADRLTFRTSRAWASIERFLCMMPSPPSWASAIAKADSVTVSIGAESTGMFRTIPAVRLDRVSASPGMTADRRGSNSTSSKVIPSSAIFEDRMEGEID